MSLVDFEAEAKRQRLLLDRLEAEHAKLLEAYYAGVMPLEVFGREQTRITRTRQQATEVLTSAELGRENIESHLDLALDLMKNVYAAYEAAPEHIKRQINQSYFERVYFDVSDDIITINSSEFAKPFGALMTLTDRPEKAMEKLNLSKPKNRTKRPASSHEPIFYADSSKESLMVGVRGLEPPTSASRTLRATSCATPRKNLPILTQSKHFC